MIGNPTMTIRGRGMRKSWANILSVAAEIVESYDTGVTLRQLFYRLVAREILRNTRSEYTQLSNRTAEARRQGEFPALVDKTRTIHQPITFEDPTDAKDWLRGIYRRDRTEGQEWTVYLGVEKHGIVNQLNAWFEKYGVPILSLGGYSSQTYVDEVIDHKSFYNRPAVLIYAGDFDPSGEDIQRDFTERVGVFDRVKRIALTAEQIREYDLPPQMGKSTDSRAAAFEQKYGELVQVELDALPPDTLRALYTDLFMKFFDTSIWKATTDREETERMQLV